MPGFLKQATAAQSRALGPFIDSTDFKTPLTALTIANTDIKLVVNGGAVANKNALGGTHRSNGVYGVTFDATDTATVGEMDVSVVVAGALPVFDKFFVLEEAVYDAMFGSAAPGPQVPIWASAGSTVSLSATTVSAVTTTATATAVTTVNGLAAGVITAAAIASGAIDADSLATDAVDEIADGVWNEPVAGHVGAGTFGKTDADILADTNELQVDWVNGGRLDLLIDAIISELAKVPKSDSTVSLNATALAAIADALLDRNMATGADSGTTIIRTPRQALRALRNKWVIAAGTLTVNKEDDATASWTSALTGTAGADPITTSDPAGP